MIGNKCDLESDRQVTYEEGLQFQNDNKLDYFIETSAKLDLNIKEVFMSCVKIWYKEYLKYANLLRSNSAFSSVDTNQSTNSFKFKKPPKETKETNQTEHIEIKEKTGCSC